MKLPFKKQFTACGPLNDTEVPRYFSYIMKFACGMGTFLANSNPNTIPHLTGDQLRGYRFPKPPREEQEEIAEFLDAKIGEFDSISDKANEVNQLLQERRTALISAAVTGKIDVRGWKPPSSARMPETEMEVA